LKLKTKSNQIH